MTTLPAVAPGQLPTGTVTFLFSDVEGSVKLWEREPEGMRLALRRHDELIEWLARRHNGAVVRPRGEGDSRFCVFARATDAVAAAAALQRALQDEAWPAETPLRVRLALHTGEADLRDGDYYGSAVNRCARLRAIAHGGQTLLSDVTAGLVRDALPTGVELLDLGEYRLRDLTRPERVTALVVPGVPSNFPALRALDARPHNLPVPATRLIGREVELAALRERLLDETVRLVTLTGPGGTGKTRLALEAAAQLVDEFEDGVVVVSLAPIRDPALVPAAIAQALGVREAHDRPAMETVKDDLREKRALLVLDNFEQLLAPGGGDGFAAEAPRLVSELLVHCPRLKALVTSREPLRLMGEHELPVPALLAPEAVRLFAERAAAVRPDFALSGQNSAAVGEICRRLDGLPLAIELAATRTAVLAPAVMLARLRGWLQLLTRGARDAAERHQTLRGAIGWSYDLLPQAEQALFRGLAVFAGGFSLEAAEAICGGLATDVDHSAGSGQAVLDGLTSLLEKNLLVRADDATSMPNVPEGRFRLLETIREFAEERLEASGEACARRRAHAACFTALAEDVFPHTRGPDQVAWADRMDTDLENFRAALEWCTAPSTAADETERAELGLRLAHAVHRTWLQRGRARETLRRLGAALAQPGAQRASAARARALATAALLSEWQAADDEAAARLARESVDLWRALGEPEGAADPLRVLADLTRRRGDEATARAQLEESLALSRASGDRSGVRWSLEDLADLAAGAGQAARAAALYEEALTLARGDGDDHSVAALLRSVGQLRVGSGDAAGAAQMLRESLGISVALRDVNCGLRCLEALGRAELATGSAVRSARLFGTSAALRETMGVAVPMDERTEYDDTLEAMRRALGRAGYEAAVSAGRALAFEAAAAEALSAAESEIRPEARGRPAEEKLTRREREVAALVAQGLTSREIAARLVIAERTAETHVEHILAKLGFRTRAQVGGWLAEQGSAEHRLVGQEIRTGVG